MKLTEVKQSLAAEQIQLTKSLGQNFLHDENQLGKIVRAAELTGQDRVLEIGPGMGALTQHLLPIGGELLCVEKDRRLVDFLRRRFAGQARLTLVHADALDYLREQSRDWSEWKMVSNLPYSVGSPILVELAKTVGAPRRMVVTVQHEVAQRLAAGAGNPEYGILSLLVQVRYDVKLLFKIPATCFFPVPDVESACVALVCRPEPLLEQKHVGTFEKLVKRAFSQRRKMMFKLLKADWPATKLEAAFATTSLAPQARAETVRLEQFIELTRLLRAK